VDPSNHLAPLGACFPGLGTVQQRPSWQRSCLLSASSPWPTSSP
jgi:hypothetical protein